MARLRRFADIQFGELVEVQSTRPDLLKDAGALAQYLRIDPGDVGELEELLQSLATLRESIGRTSGAFLRVTDAFRSIGRMTSVSAAFLRVTDAFKPLRIPTLSGHFVHPFR